MILKDKRRRNGEKGDFILNSSRLGRKRRGR
jgi:hypothetical protein